MHNSIESEIIPRQCVIDKGLDISQSNLLNASEKSFMYKNKA